MAALAPLQAPTASRGAYAKLGRLKSTKHQEFYLNYGGSEVFVPSTTTITESRTNVQVPIQFWWASACQVPDLRKCLRAKVPVNNACPNAFPRRVTFIKHQFIVQFIVQFIIIMIYACLADCLCASSFHESHIAPCISILVPDCIRCDPAGRGLLQRHGYDIIEIIQLQTASPASASHYPRPSLA